jgi:hypothetical protein
MFTFQRFSGMSLYLFCLLGLTFAYTRRNAGDLKPHSLVQQAATVMAGKVYFVKTQKFFFYATGGGGSCGENNPDLFRDITLSQTSPLSCTLKDNTNCWYDERARWQIAYSSNIPCLQYSTTSVMILLDAPISTYLDVCTSGSCTSGSVVNGNLNIRGAKRDINPTTCSVGPNCNISTWVVEGPRPAGQCVLEGDLIYLRNREKNMLLYLGCSGSALQISSTQATQFYFVTNPDSESGVITPAAPPPGPLALNISGGGSGSPPPPPAPVATYRLVARQTWSGNTSAFTSTSWSLNANDPNNANYAILDKLNLYKLTTGSNAGKWQFKLVYYSVGKGSEQEWIQSSNPTTSATVTGYTPLHIFATDNCWGGLHTHPTNALLVGSTCNGLYWYAVGLYVPWTWNGVMGLPAASTVVNSVSLYVWDDTMVTSPSPITPTSPSTPTSPTGGVSLGNCNDVWCSSKDRICTNASTCCSGLCTNSYCTCALNGGICSEDRNCCAGQCSGGFCVSGYGYTQSCSQDNQCSSRNCVAGSCDSDRVNALISCPAGKTVVAGGAKCSSGSALLKSAPYTDGKKDKWNVICSSNYAFDAYAFCC